ncbi:DUF4234 domain-containing protein [Clostridium chrysemydis]|uniref:DUF4234 domain-containing protein n=1 Tax=Clostridium chrysemydis TaxID=2665504 RepID=UPI003F31C6A3
MIKQRNFWILILLNLVTCGIYGIVFMYQYTQDLNRVCKNTGKESINYLLVILLSIITCGIYYYVWIFQQGNRMQETGFKNHLNIQENGSILVLWNILGSFLCGIGPFVAMYIMVKNMNILADAYNDGILI